MIAYIDPLEGKYYGTTISIKFENGEFTSICIWHSDGNPSDRELEKWGYTRKQWNNNEEVDNGWEGTSPIRDMDLISDSHYESVTSYELAKIVVDAINIGCLTCFGLHK